MWIENGFGGVTSAPLLTYLDPQWHMAASLVPNRDGGSWIIRSPLLQIRYQQAAASVGGRVYALGGRFDTAIDEYNPNTNSWTAVGNLKRHRGRFGAAVVEGLIYSVGRRDLLVGRFGTLVPQVEAFNHSTNVSTDVTNIPTPREGPGVGVINGIIYTVGGSISAINTPINVVEAYDPVSNTWTTKAPMPTARFDLPVAVVNGILYAFGGQVPPSDFAVVEAYDPATNTWTTKPSMPTLRGSLGAGVIDGIIYVVGVVSSGYPDVVEAYDPVLNRWTTKTPMPSSRAYIAAAVANGWLYSIGGWFLATPLSNVEAFQPNPR